MIQAIEVQVISKILTAEEDSNDIDTLLSFSPDLYFSAYKSEIMYIHDQKSRYNIIPSAFDFQAQFPDFNIVRVPEPVEYLVTKLKEYRSYLILLETFNKIKDLGDGDVKAAWHYIAGKAEEATILEDSQPMDIVKEADVRAEQIKEYSKQKRIPTGFPEIDKVMYGGLSTVEELLVIIARTNSGKAQPLDSPVLTVNGWVKMGDLKIGDKVVGLNDDVGTVVDIFPQGQKDYYRVYFDDNTYAECCMDHLWTVFDNSYRYEQVIPLSVIASDPQNYSIPITSTDYHEKSKEERIEELRTYHGISINEHFITSCYLCNRVTAIAIADLVRSLGYWVQCEFVEYDRYMVTIDKLRWIKRIVRIEHQGETECQCIMLDNDSHTYITSDYIVTHNTWVCTKMMETAQKNKFPVAYYSPEMQSAYLGTRFDTWRGHFENSRLYRGDYSSEYYAYLKNLQTEETSAYIIEDKDFPDGVSVRTLDPFVKEHGIKLLIIDGISYMMDDQKAVRDQEKYKNIALGLFKISKKYGCAVVLVMQANREVKSKDDKGESIPTLYNAEGSDQPARIATQAFGIRQIFDKHVLDIGLLKSRMANNTNPVFSYAWDINTGQAQYIPGDSAEGNGGFGITASPEAPILSTPSVSFGNAQPDSNDLSLLDDDDSSDIEF